MKWTLESVYCDLLIPAQNALTQVEHYGVLWDVDKAIELRETELMPQIKQLGEVCNDIVGQPINLNSPKQVQHYLYNMRKLKDPKVNKQKRAQSTDKDTREHMLAVYKDIPADLRAFLEATQEWKRLDKLRSTYIDGIIERIGPDGRLHCEFPLFGTETGRLSSRNPNLQNQPRGSFIRQLYIAPEGRCILSADYSQAELRTAATLSGDANLIRVYTEKRDLHAESARTVYGDGFGKAERDKAKRVNFGILYEQGAYSLSLQERMPQKECQVLIDTFWHLYPDCRHWLSSVQSGAINNGHAQSPFGRVRRFPLITNAIKDEIQRQAGNFVIQSTASDFTLWALIKLLGRLDPSKCKIVITVHDSIICECDLDYRLEAAQLLIDSMEASPRETQDWSIVNFDVEASYGKNWGHQKELSSTDSP